MALFVDTYVEVETANLYLSASSVWLGATTPEKTSALIAASQTFEDYSWLSSVVDPDQPMSWPRKTFSYYDKAKGTTIEVTAGTVPKRLERAVCNLALHFLTYPEALNQYNAKYTSISVGPISLSAASSVDIKIPMVPSAVKSLVLPFLEEGSGGYLWWRAN